MTDARGQLDRRDWEVSAATHMQSVWFTDCRSVVTALSKPVVRTTDKRLGIELASMHQQLWRYVGRDDIKKRLQDGPPARPTDLLRWIDTHVMAADCLTKPMSDEFLQQVLDSGTWCVAQPELGRIQKERKSLQRAAAKHAQKNNSGGDTSGEGEPE